MIRRLVVPLVAGAMALSLLLYLGFWQLSRMDWKLALIAQVEARLHEAPVEFPNDWSGLTREKDEYRRVVLRGTFLHENELFLYAVQPEPAPGKPGFGGQGFFVVTPFVLADQRVILVNRGFVPLARKDAASRVEGQISGVTQITGLIRFSETPSIFTPSDNVQRREFYSRNVEAMMKAANLSGADFLIEQDISAIAGGLPQGGVTRVTFSNKHFEYALTWFGLALTLIGVLAAFFISQFRQAAKPD